MFIGWYGASYGYEATGHIMVPVFESRCDFPLDHVVVVVGPTIFFLIMFSRFYVKTYLKKQMTMVIKDGALAEIEQR
ncbi:elongation of very long chain fatty acids protein 4-like [Tropilaelaps mercedesae]|uniref:Elongation of very long chain fatty acids protein 4-like n=1 Tax=Tropilaelaps mercedesae TaxID=418985 RepID=A0A1V9X2E9_9ACAR|nr:elongation of very long chain fatty acids protein 4-like [Tropilaelaps mercedesae]